MLEPTLLSTLDSGVLPLTLNRPAKPNAIDNALAIVRHPRPVLAAVHGWLVGAGFEWAMDADVVVVADDARFKLPEASIGVYVTGGLVATLPTIVGLSWAKAPMLCGEEFGARQAVSTASIARSRKNRTRPAAW